MLTRVPLAELSLTWRIVWRRDAANRADAANRPVPQVATGRALSRQCAARLTVIRRLRSYAPMLLKDKRIIVTGGASGIGAATVRAYVAEGARVVSVDVNDSAGAQVASGAGSNAHFMHCDIADRKDVFAVFERAATLLGGLDAMANVAGVERRTPAEDIPDEEWDLIFGVNVKGTLYTNQAA